MPKKKPTSLADALFPTEEQEDYNESILSIRPEQRRLHTDTYDFTVLTLIDQFLSGRIYVPPYQRRYIWTTGQASRLIESLIIQCPIPVIYLAQDKAEGLAVIDGNQRINALVKYFDNQFALSGLTAYPELDQSFHRDLDERIKRHIGHRTIRCIVILKETHPQVKFDVFERLNSGSVKLAPQELRHGLYFGSLIKRVEKIAKNKKFLSIIKIKGDKRMKAEELVVRFLAFSEMYASYEKPLGAFLNKFADKYKDSDEHTLDRMDKSFSQAVDVMNDMYGDKAFQIWNEGKRISSFNSALFDAEMHLANLIAIGLRASVKGAFKKTMDLVFNDEKFRNSISYATSDQSSVADRMRIIEGLS